MIVYVCYFDYDDEGYSEPMIIFADEKLAIQWVKEEGGSATYEAMQVHGRS